MTTISNIDENKINIIVERVINKIKEEQRKCIVSHAVNESPSIQNKDVFEGINSAVKAAIKAQKELITLSVEKRKDIIIEMRRVCRENVETISRLALEETQMGRFEDKMNKNLLVINKTPGIEDLKPVAFSGDDGLTIVERAPYGVIGSITPSTNPSETIINNGIGMFAGGNAVVFNPHPQAKKVSIYTVNLLNNAIVSNGGPENVFSTIAEPTIESAGELMKHKGVDLLVVTGGPGVVKAAMESGKKVIAAGPGNPPVLVDETANLDKAARDIVSGTSLDNNIVCVVEKEIIVVDSIADELKKLLIKNNAFELNESQLKRLMKVIFEGTGESGKPGLINKRLVGKNASVIMKEINVDIPDEIRIVFAEVDADHPLVLTEQLMPVIPIVRVKNASDGIELAKKVEHNFRHTAVIHSRNIETLSRMAKVMNTAIFVKNGPSYAGLGMGGEGFTSFTIASPTGEGLTSAKHFTKERRCVLVDYFRIV